MLERWRLRYRLRFGADGVAVERGRPAPAFVSACRDIARLHGITHGELECRGRGRAARLVFSKDFPARGRQAIRNVWTPPSGPGSRGNKRASGG